MKRENLKKEESKVLSNRKKKTDRNSIKKRNLKEKGITLVALVVTIIILLILAGVAISAVTSDNGLFKKARDATNMYKDAERDEQGILGDAKNELSKLLNPSGTVGGSGEENPPTPPEPEEPKKIEGLTTSEVISKITGEETEAAEVKIGEKTLWVPPSFTISEESAETIDEGIVVEDEKGNEWVWIPCYVEGGVGSSVVGAIKYDRYKFKNQVYTSKGNAEIKQASYEVYFTEEPNLIDESSIRKFGGYYIGRYEAGDGTVSGANPPRLRTKSDKGTTQNNIVTIKKGQAPYNFVTVEQSKSLSEGISNANNYDTSKIYTKLCSSYAWDTALKFIGGNYTNNSTQGNYKDTSFNYTDITGTEKTKQKDKYCVVPTGQTTPVKNIYDMGGNVGDFVSEKSNEGMGGYAYRGSYFYYRIFRSTRRHSIVP